VSFAAITLCVASQRVFIVVSVYFVIYSVRKVLVTPSYLTNTRRTVCLFWVTLVLFCYNYLQWRFCIAYEPY